jgi:putative transposase
MIRVHKIELKPNNKQKTYFKNACGVARFAYNWALNEWKEQYKKGISTNEGKLRKELNSIKKDLFPWMIHVTKSAPQQAIKNLGQAFKRYFNKVSAYPKFKKKGKHDSFRADNGPQKVGLSALKIIDKKVQLPIIGFVKLKEKLRFIGQIKSGVISRHADRWFLAISVEVENSSNIYEKQDIVGVDLGLKTYACLSTGKEIPAFLPYNNLLKKVKFFHRKLSRKKQNSKNKNKARCALMRLHAKISNIRVDRLHKLTHELSKFKGICIEDLNISGMQKNKKLARYIQDCGFYEFRRQLKYKCELNNTNLIIANRFFASSKICSSCGHKYEHLKLIERVWNCSNCNTKHNRDLNAAYNLRNYYISSFESTASSAGINALGKISSDYATVA